MSGAARRRGAGRATRGQASETSSRRGDRLQAPGGGFDGPASRGTGSGIGSQSRGPSNPSVGPPHGSGSAPQGSQAGSRRSSQSGGPPAQTAGPSVPVTQGDPARDEPSRYTDALRNVDLPASFYNIDQLFKKRPAFNNSGKPVQLAVNAYTVTQYPNVNVYQYDVIIGDGSEKRAVQRKVWASKTRKDATGAPMIYDGNRLAWSLIDHGEGLRLMVDLDSQDGRPSRGAKNTFRLHIKKTRTLDINVVQQYLNGTIQFGIPVAEAINFMDHLLREGPSVSDEFLSVRRSIFKRDGERSDLGGGIEVWRGIYQSMRLAEGKKLIINLDVANTCFWKPASLIGAIIAKNREISDPSAIVKQMEPKREDNGQKSPSVGHKAIEKDFKGLIVYAKYPGNPLAGKEWKIYRFDINNCNEETIEWRDPQTKKPTGEMVTIAQYFKRKYNTALQYPKLPLVEMTKKGVKYPMELLHIPNGQRFPAKLDEFQTANMIKFAVSPPAVRLKAINEGKSWLDWNNDKYLVNYGLRVENEPIRTNARILPPPSIKFGNNVVESPGTRGRWDLKGKKFLTGNVEELVAWGVGMFPGRSRPDKSAIDKFCLDFARAYRNHGGRVSNKPPYIKLLNKDAGKAVEEFHQECGNFYNRKPQLLVFLVQDRQAFHYLRIKKSCDCRYGVVSQVMQIPQVLKGNPQYYSNVLMKVNAKLGGCTSQVVPHATSGFKSFSAPTMIIGADVSHASPGSPQASMAALTVSYDRHGGRYAAACQTNGHRVEMISAANFHDMLRPLIQNWIPQVGGNRLPQQVYYMRDGVSEGQFLHVLNQEVPNIKSVLNSFHPQKKWEGKITVIIASKRHHVRAFPTGAGADNKGNPLPGCLIERDVTMPNEWDFFLYSHIALQGTSRPVHYTVLYDDANHRPETLQNMIYEHCYQYMRSTTSVSLHPAVYYAHLASNRAKAHEDITATQGPQGGAGYKAKAPVKTEQPSDTETKKLMPLFNGTQIKFAMWYI
ncbi:Protein argonaute [Exophiala dermatitidis]|nr:Protein argonaute [Exophiala dermatitidis]KAJ4543353.1 Protein argonaute [Exophiala dermatitidis]